MIYKLYEYERAGCAKHLMIQAECVTEDEPVRDWIARPDEIRNLEYKGEVEIDTNHYMPEYWEAG